MHKPLTTSLLALSLGLVACGSPPEPSAVRARISGDLHHVLTEAVAAAKTTDALPGTAATGMLARALGRSSGTASALMARTLRSTTHRSLTASSTSIDPDAVIAALDDKLFTDANYQGDGIYTVPASLVCETITVDSQGNETTGIDAACAANLATAQLRVRVGDDSSTLSFAIQVDANHDEPLSFELNHDSIAVSVHLDDAAKAMTALAPLFGEQAPNARLTGDVTAMLEILGTAHARASLTIDHAIAIAFADQGVDLDGTNAFRFTSAAAPVASAELDGTANTGAFALAVATTTLHTPGADGFDLTLPGATASAAIAPGQPLHLTNLGLGNATTTLSKHGVQAVAIDLNRDDGRKLDATITADAATGLETLTVTPKLDVRVAIDHAVLGDTPRVYDVTRVLLDGSLRGGDGSDQIEVASGAFSITTNPASFGFSASAGQCVAGTDVPDPATGDYYTQWTVGSCQ